MAFDSRGLLVIPGAQKAGTTSLWRLLLQHESVYSLGRSSRSMSRSTPALKEPQFFTLKEDIIRENLDWYTSLIIDDERNGPGWYVDASTGYLYSPRAPELIESLPFPVKFLVLLREPAERTFSSFLEMNAKTPPVDQRTFAEIVNFVWENRDLGIKRAENESIRKAKNEERINTEYLMSHVKRMKKRFKMTEGKREIGEYLQDPLWCYKYFQGSLYSKWVKSFEKVGSNLMVISMKEMISDANKIAKKIFDYLDLNHCRVELPHENQTWRSPPWIKKMRDFGSSVMPGQGWWKKIRGILPYNISASAKQVKSKNKKTIDKARYLLKAENEYWSKRKPSVLEK